MPSFENAKWIWPTKEASPDEYGEFYFPFTYSGGKCELLISADSNYAVYIGEKLAAFGQYADYPHDKVYDVIDVGEFCKTGENSLSVIVWYYGIGTTQVYCPGRAALMLELFEDGRSIAASGESTPARISRAYENHRQKIITGQLGFSFAYDATREDGWMRGELSGFSPAEIVEQTLPLRKRSAKRPVAAPTVIAPSLGPLLSGEEVFDLEENEVGLLYIKASSTERARIRVSYGEHIADGEVRRIIYMRDFSVEITLKAGVTEYVNPFRRLGARYLQVDAPDCVTVEEIGLVPVVYPLEHMPRPKLTRSEADIYAACVRTLTLCMHEHYEDCPWREQALYTMDSRNQMLTGYYAFGEYEFPRANLELIASDRRDDGLLSICYPMSGDLVIPSFSLHYFTACREYLDHSGDCDFITKIYPKLESVIDVFIKRERRDGVLPPFPRGGCYWNFYEWSPGLASEDDLNNIHTSEVPLPPSEPDLILNALFIIALENMAKMSIRVGKTDKYTAIANEIREATREYFFDLERGLFFDRKDARTYSVLGNSLAILAGLSATEYTPKIAEALTVPEKFGLTPVSLSMRCFLNDALLLTDREKYAPYILSEIERIYRPMIDYGTGTVWETELGEADFENAGSLCHGWSALPVYYYHILK